MPTDVHEQTKQALSTVFFTKEFPGFEIESKWRLLTENPVPTVLRFMADMCVGDWGPIRVASSMGDVPILRYSEVQIDFWATGNRSGMRKPYYRQVATAFTVPGLNMYLVNFKEDGVARQLCESLRFLNPPLVRREERKGGWVREQEAVALVLNHFPSAEKVATMMRQKCYVYAHNAESWRNFSVSADLCYCGPRILSQVEIEYIGRSGIQWPDTTGCQIAFDFLQIHKILSGRYGDILVPTTQTKFELILGG